MSREWDLAIDCSNTGMKTWSSKSEGRFGFKVYSPYIHRKDVWHDVRGVHQVGQREWRGNTVKTQDFLISPNIINHVWAADTLYADPSNSRKASTYVLDQPRGVKTYIPCGGLESLLSPTCFPTWFFQKSPPGDQPLPFNHVRNILSRFLLHHRQVKPETHC